MDLKLMPWLHCPVTNASRLFPINVNSARWQELYSDILASFWRLVIHLFYSLYGQAYNT